MVLLLITSHEQPSVTLAAAERDVKVESERAHALETKLHDLEYQVGLKMKEDISTHVSLYLSHLSEPNCSPTGTRRGSIK